MQLAEKVRQALLVIFRDWFVNGLLASALFPAQLRWLVLRLSGYTIKRCYIAGGVFIGGKNVQIGEGTFINYRTFLDGAGPLQIGRNVRIGMQVTIVTGSHEIGGPSMRAGEVRPAPVTIGDGVWIGARATILPDVCIGAGVVIAAGAVVTSDCSPNTLYAGVPARPMRVLTEI
jgi:maltose O-acetyltransferase